MSIIEVMEKRVSVRTYLKELPDPLLLERVKRIVEKKRRGPFGDYYSFSLFKGEEENSEEIVKMTSYGMIRNASLYFGGYSGSDERSLVDYGYCFEEVVLELTALELGTCWLGGTFSRGYVASVLSLPEGKIIPAISPVGISGEKRSIPDRISRFVAGSGKRKPLHRILYHASENGEIHPMGLADLDAPHDEILEMVRLAPSASNKQPWRIVRQGNMYHFYCEYDRNYNRFFHIFKIQSLDMGIALCHFTKSAEELRLGGTFSYADPHFDKTDWTYILSWKIN